MMAVAEEHESADVQFTAAACAAEHVKAKPSTSDRKAEDRLGVPPVDVHNRNDNNDAEI